MVLRFAEFHHCSLKNKTVEVPESSGPDVVEFFLCPRLCALKLSNNPNSCILVSTCEEVVVVYANRLIRAGEVISVHFQPMFCHWPDLFLPPAIVLHNSALRMIKLGGILGQPDFVAHESTLSLISRVQALAKEAFHRGKESKLVEFLSVVGQLCELFTQNSDFMGVTFPGPLSTFMTFAHLVSVETGKPDPTEPHRLLIESRWQADCHLPEIGDKEKSAAENLRAWCEELFQRLSFAAKELAGGRSVTKPILRHCARCFKEVSEPVKCPDCDDRAYCSDPCRLKDWTGPKGVSHKRWCGGLWSEEDTDWAVFSGLGLDAVTGCGVIALRDFRIGEAILVDRLLTRFEFDRSRLFRAGDSSIQKRGDMFDRSHIKAGAKKFIGPRFLKIILFYPI